MRFYNGDVHVPLYRKALILVNSQTLSMRHVFLTFSFLVNEHVLNIHRSAIAQQCGPLASLAEGKFEPAN